MTTTATLLLCEHCGRDELHEIRYAGDVMTTITCFRCGKATGASPWVIEQYMRGLVSRAAHKPGKMIRAAVHDPQTFLVQLPGSLATKPVRLAAELEEFVRIELAPWAHNKLGHHRHREL